MWPVPCKISRSHPKLEERFPSEFSCDILHLSYDILHLSYDTCLFLSYVTLTCVHDLSSLVDDELFKNGISTFYIFMNFLNAQSTG